MIITMNRLISLLVFVCLISKNLCSIAQSIMVGDPYYFCALNGSCYNSIPNRLTTIVDSDYDPASAVYYTEQFMNIHPGVELLAPASLLYNCHGYAYSIYQGGEILQIGWKDLLCSYNGTTIVSYVEIPESNIRQGDIATIVDNNTYPLYSMHSSIVYNSDTLISKWGNDPLVKHYKYAQWIVNETGVGSTSHYVYYRRVINNTITGPSTFNGTGVYTFDYDVAPTTCTWSVEPAAMFQTSSGTGYTANLSYATPFTYLAPKATLTFTFSYGCDNHYTATKEIDLRIPTTTISGIAVSDGFIIDTNAVITVTGEIRSNKNTKIIIPNGTRLLIDGGIMTDNGNVIWQGIEVWGDCRTHQYQVNGAYQQGYIEMKNGATIENAMCAIRLWNPNHSGSTGGIIHATDAVFRNNIRSVEAMNFTNYLPGTVQERPYNGWFKNCEFTIDGDYLGNKTFFEHVYLTNVNGVKFEGCTFSVSPNANNISLSCSGIGAYSAGFTVMSYCTDNNTIPCPANSLIHSTFTGFGNGILSVNDGGNARTFSVTDAVFTNNNRGIFAQNTGYATILSNEFEIGCNMACGYGVYADGVTGFCIEENDFHSMTGNSCTTCGVGIFNSVGVNDVYRNTFDGLSFGNLSYGVNHTANLNGPLPPTIQGLTYSCNDNTDNDIDFCVLKDNSSGGIAWQQGSLSVPAGNTFSGNTYHFYNDGNFNVDYYYYSVNPDETPSSSKLYQVITHDTKTQNDCNSHYGGNGGGVVKNAGEKTALAEIYQTSDNTHSRYMAAGDIVRSNLMDSISNPAELRQWLGNMHNISSDRMIVASYVHEGDFTNAIALAESLPDTYNLQNEALSDHNDYMLLLKLYQKLYNSNRTIRDLTKEETEMVTDIAENGSGTSQLMARGILMETPDRYIEPFICPELPNSGRGSDKNNAVISGNENIEVSISPVPATTWATIDYKLPEKTAKATLTIVNTMGVKMMDVEILGCKGSKVIDLRHITNGVYYLIINGDVTKTKKFVIVK